MKLKVNRQLRGGQYRVSFEVGDFSQEEVSKMASFGIPVIQLKWFSPQGPTSGPVPLTKLNGVGEAVFGTDEEAKAYERQVTAQVQAAIQIGRASCRERV